MATEQIKTCPICGAPTRVYMGHARKDGLCGTHADMLKNGELIKYEDENETIYFTQKEAKGYKQIDSLPNEGYSTCQICGKKTNGYAFCRDCWELYDSDFLLDVLNDKAEAEYVKEQRRKADEEKNNKSTQVHEEIIKPVITIDLNNKSRCITCGRKTDGLLFCVECYNKYKEKELLVKITRCKSVELLDETYESIYRCKDGHMVKSKSERDIDNYLFEHNIRHIYEAPLSYGSSKSEILHPDFMLVNYLGDGENVYIEHWGYNDNNMNYQNSKKFKMEKYKEKKITLICTFEESDAKDIQEALDRKLTKEYIKKNQINYDENKVTK